MIIPTPLFDTLENMQQTATQFPHTKLHAQDFQLALDFLKQYNGSEATFRAYRREMERLLQWAWLIEKKSILLLKRNDIENYIAFCQKPPTAWIGTKNVARFVADEQGQRSPNPAWRLFVCKVNKADFKQGVRAKRSDYQLSQKAVREVFTVVGSFYSHLINEGVADVNPVLLIRQKSKYFTKRQGAAKIPRLTAQQWSHCIAVAETLAAQHPAKHERTLFIMTALYLLYLRISELAASKRWEPQMGHFYQDANQQWWFMTLGKGNKERTISVSDGMLAALKRYRQSLSLTPLPVPGEKHPLIAKIRGQGAISSDREIRTIVQTCFDLSIITLRTAGYEDDANALEHATVHWLRHTGISDDINLRGRPQNHVRDDAGHSSILITDRYNDALMQERHHSGKQKSVKPKSQKSTTKFPQTHDV